MRSLLLLFSVLPAMLSITVEPVYSEGHTQQTESSLWNLPKPTTEQLNATLSDTAKRVEEIPKDAQDNSPEGQRRAILKDRTALILEWRGLTERIQELQTNAEKISSEQPELTRALDLEERKKPPEPPKVPTPEGFQETQNIWNASVRTFDEIQLLNKERRDIISTLPERIAQVKERQKIARKEIEKFKELSAKESGLLRDSILMQADNARIKIRVTEENLRLLAEEQLFENGTAMARDQRLDLARMRQRWHEQAVILYRQALNQIQDTHLRQKEVELLEKSKNVAQAGTPGERFLKSWEVGIARLAKNIADLSKLKTDLSTLIATQEKKLNSEREELKNLKEMGKNTGLNEHVAEVLQSAFRDIEIRRQNLPASVPKEIVAKLEELGPRLLEINMNLSSLRDRWTSELPTAEVGINESERRHFEKNADQLLDSYRELLGREKQLLLEIDSDKRRLNYYPAERKEVLIELESYVLSKIFWIQDAAPINLGTFRIMIEEIFSSTRSNSLLKWWGQVLSKETLSTLYKALWQPLFLTGFLFLSLALPTLFFLARRTLGSRQSLVGLLLPTYLIILGIMISASGLPASIGAVSQRILWHVAFFSLAWILSRFLCAPSGLFVSRFGMPAQVTNSLFNSIRLALLSYLICLLPWMIFKEAPFKFEALPRIGILLFEIGVALAVFRLIRPTSSLAQYAFGATKEDQASGPKPPSMLSRYWPTISRLSILFMLAVIGLDALGFRFSSQQLAKSGLLTLLTLFCLIGLYHLILAVLTRIIKSRRRIPAASAPGQKTTTSKTEFIEQIRKTLRFAFIIIGILLLTEYWGLDESIFLALGEVTLNSVTGVGGTIEFITLADLTRFLLGMILLIWIVRHLPKLFELLIFSSIKVDSGLRYAIVTMTRYMVFLVGLFISFSFLKFDLAKVGWLVAAISVGLGFGLQEIVANFVSGIILLVERPIRVGDTITVGTSFGKVTRINIRSTTILTPDLQELLIPNRDLITKEVTNWTLGNTNIRLLVHIGVAYGSNIDKVMEILSGLAQAQPECLKNPPPEVLFMNHGASSLDFELRLFLPDPSQRMPMLSRMNRLINKAFSDNNIEIPFPQQDIHLRTGVSSLLPTIETKS